MPRMLLSSEDFRRLAGETTFSDYPRSNLTFSSSASSKKRTYKDLSPHNNLEMQSQPGSSAGATTSGRPLATIEPPLSGHIVSILYSQNAEIDAFVRFQTKQLQSGIEILSMKHSRELLSMIEQQAAKRIRVKEMELEYLSKRNTELEVQVTQMAAESQVWFNYAKTSEAVVSSLREKLDEVLNKQISCPAIDGKAGYGDSGGDPFTSTSNTEEVSATDNKINKVCRFCSEREVCVLLLPCRHLCVCKGCESRTQTCPACNSTINASIQVVVC